MALLDAVEPQANLLEICHIALRKGVDCQISNLLAHDPLFGSFHTQSTLVMFDF